MLEEAEEIGRPYVASPAENQWQAAATSIVRELRRFDLARYSTGRHASRPSCGAR